MADDRAYRVLLRFVPEKEGFVAAVPELGIESTGATRAEAIAGAEEAIETRLGEAAGGETLPPPADSATASDTTLSLKLAAPIYRELAFHAQSEGMGLDAFAQNLLAYSIGTLDGSRPSRARRTPQPIGPEANEERGPSTPLNGERRTGRPAPSERGNDRGSPDRGAANANDRGPIRGRGRRDREGYRPELEDKANFLEYLRNLEKGGGGRGRGRP